MRGPFDFSPEGVAKMEKVLAYVKMALANQKN